MQELEFVTILPTRQNNVLQNYFALIRQPIRGMFIPPSVCPSYF